MNGLNDRELGARCERFWILASKSPELFANGRSISIPNTLEDTHVGFCSLEPSLIGGCQC